MKIVQSNYETGTNGMAYNLQERWCVMSLEHIVSILIKLLEDQENVKIKYKIIPDEPQKSKEETA